MKPKTVKKNGRWGSFTRFLRRWSPLFLIGLLIPGCKASRANGSMDDVSSWAQMNPDVQDLDGVDVQIWIEELPGEMPPVGYGDPKEIED